jgi:hypothetical protein
MKFAGPLLVPSVPIPKRALTALCPQLVADRLQAKGEIARRRGVMKQLITRQPPLGWVHESGPSNIRQQGVNGEATTPSFGSAASACCCASGN